MVEALSLLKENMSNIEGSWLPPRSDGASKLGEENNKNNFGTQRTGIRHLTAMKIFCGFVCFLHVDFILLLQIGFFHITKDPSSHLSFFVKELQ